MFPHPHTRMLRLLRADRGSVLTSSLTKTLPCTTKGNLFAYQALDYSVLPALFTSCNKCLAACSAESRDSCPMLKTAASKMDHSFWTMCRLHCLVCFVLCVWQCPREKGNTGSFSGRAGDHNLVRLTTYLY